MVSYTAAVLSFFLMRGIAADEPLIAGYQAYTDVSSELALDVEVKAFASTVDPQSSCNPDGSGCTSLDDLEEGMSIYKDSVVSSFPSWTSTKSSVMQKFIDYYGEDYSPDDWVTSALKGEETSFDNGADFSLYPGTPQAGSSTLIGREETAKKGLGYTTMKIEMFQMMDQAVFWMGIGCDADDDCSLAINAWDKAVAYYVGSLEGEDGNNDPAGSYGVFPYALADKRCTNYGTCGSSGSSKDKSLPALTNLNMISLFNEGAEHVMDGDIDKVKGVIQEIESASVVPYIQGFLRYAYKVGMQGKDYDKERAEGIAFAYGALPHIHACSEDAAETIYDNLKVGSQSVDYDEVKEAAEDVYSCLGITCDDVGGLMDGDSYYRGAEPC